MPRDGEPLTHHTAGHRGGATGAVVAHPHLLKETLGARGKGIGMGCAGKLNDCSHKAEMLKLHNMGAGWPGHGLGRDELGSRHGTGTSL